MTDKTGLKAAELFAEGTTKLKELGLKWNKLTAVSGNRIADSLRENRQMKVLDLSWNSIGVRPKAKRQNGKVIQTMLQGEIGKSWGSFFIENKTLIHLDLSFNKIDEFETSLISNDIKFNQSCVGFHYNGNTGPMNRLFAKVDSLGFMRMIDVTYQKISEESRIPDGSPGRKKIMQRNANKKVHLTERRDSSFSINSTGVVDKCKQIDTVLDNCWICENWVETEFFINLIEVWN